MLIERIDHVAIRVKDLEKANSFFSDLLGTKFVNLDDFEDMDARSLIEPFGIELVAPIKHGGPLAKEIDRRGEGFLLLSLKVSDREKAMREMKSRGIRDIGRIERGGMKAAVFHPKDTYGIMIELIEYKSEHPLAAAVIQR